MVHFTLEVTTSNAASRPAGTVAMAVPGAVADGICAAALEGAPAGRGKAASIDCVRESRPQSADLMAVDGKTS